MIYHILDWFFLIFHTILTVFNLSGWIWKKTRRLNLYTLLATGFSWFLLGIFFGMGYCFLTDLHWKVLHKLGQYDLPNSYIQYMIHRISGFNPGYKLVSTITLVAFIFSFAMSLFFNFFPVFRRKKIAV